MFSTSKFFWEYQNVWNDPMFYFRYFPIFFPIFFNYLICFNFLSFFNFLTFFQFSVIFQFSDIFHHNTFILKTYLSGVWPLPFSIGLLICIQLDLRANNIRPIIRAANTLILAVLTMLVSLAAMLNEAMLFKMTGIVGEKILENTPTHFLLWIRKSDFSKE